MRKAGWLLLCSLVAGALMTVFVMLPGSITRHLFSLGALVIGFYFFQRFETKGIRIGFVVLTLVFSFLLPPVYVLLAHANGWPVDPAFLEGVE
ncbi:hypothetical protein J31TS4_00210 [Paenibacillus sp. J31TS4]|uniref:hypothetical protein n=1 Tax=Paenibacillus sp. J31TS4 TaxID=2807195 RepID=UPI001B266FF5|nr:hypothetical protein [Paenibacillus sp. J31TS4]GIP36741.1 hypothetical protein J31TS4_00210 [Paenibacillus sp. J31TS4]